MCVYSGRGVERQLAAYNRACQHRTNRNTSFIRARPSGLTGTDVFMLVLVCIAYALYVLHCSNDLSLYTFRGVGIVRDGLPSSSAKNVTFCKLWYFCLTAKGRRAFFVLTRMRYAIVHPAIRVEVLLSSGYSGLCMEPLSSELEGNMCGRVARLCSGWQHCFIILMILRWL